MERFLLIEKPMQRADALVVMAGSKSERLPAAALLFNKKVARKILLTNDGVSSAFSNEKHRNLYDVEWAELDLMNLGIPEKAISKLTYTSSGTIHDALNTRKEVFNKGYKSIVIVTSDYHTRRSLWSFEHVFNAHDVSIGINPVKSHLSRLPAFKKFPALFLETIKYFYYRVRYSNCIKLLGL